MGKIGARLTSLPSDFFEAPKRELDTVAPPSTLGNLKQVLYKYKMGSGISDQKRLRDFMLCISPGCLKPPDFGAYLGFAMVSPTLQRITVSSGEVAAGPSFSFEPQCIALVGEALGPSAVVKL